MEHKERGWCHRIHVLLLPTANEDLGLLRVTGPCIQWTLPSYAQVSGAQTILLQLKTDEWTLLIKSYSVNLGAEVPDIILLKDVK